MERHECLDDIVVSGEIGDLEDLLPLGQCTLGWPAGQPSDYHGSVLVVQF